MRTPFTHINPAQAKRILWLRKQGKTQYQIADIVGYTQPAISAFLRRRANPKPKIVLPAKTDKLCSKCKTVKPIADFYNSSKAKDGLSYACKICMGEMEKSLKVYDALAS